jgi:N-hydroxyarylamine O-acetyltransferase
VFDLDAYLIRVGLSPQAERPTLAELHAAHCTSIPFEALDPRRGVPNSLDDADLQRKLVHERRGGYCFEQNLLLKAALEALGHQDVELYLARVLLGGASAPVRPRSHLLLKVRADGIDWHVDVGFGGGTLLEPLPWGPGGEHEQAGWRHRVVEAGPEYVLQTIEEGEWSDLYSFLPHPVPRVDVETINWWTSTHPSSAFVAGLIVSRQWRDGRRLVLSDWGGLALLERTPERTDRSTVAWADIPALLAKRFELPGFELAGDGRLTC